MITIFHGDCTQLLPVILNEVKNPIVVSDPPFNMGYHYNEYKDNMSDKDYFDMLAKLFGNSPSVVIHYPESLYRLSHEMGGLCRNVL